MIFVVGIVTREAIVESGRGLLKTPYVTHQRLPGLTGGIDCIGVPIVVGRQVGSFAPDFDVNGYSMQPDGSMLPLCDRYMQCRVSKAEMQPGDALVVSWGDDRAHHVGIVAPHTTYIGHLALIHAYPKQKMVVEHRIEFNNFMRFVSAYRFPGVPA